jgi:hypothetical protein
MPLTFRLNLDSAPAGRDRAVRRTHASEGARLSKDFSNARLTGEAPFNPNAVSVPGPNRGCRIARSDVGERGSSRLVATPPSIDLIRARHEALEAQLAARGGLAAARSNP